MEFSMSEFRRRIPELLAKAWAGERLVVVHRPGNGKARRFVICREGKVQHPTIVVKDISEEGFERWEATLINDRDQVVQTAVAESRAAVIGRVIIQAEKAAQIDLDIEGDEA